MGLYIYSVKTFLRRPQATGSREKGAVSASRSTLFYDVRSFPNASGCSQHVLLVCTVVLCRS